MKKIFSVIAIILIMALIPASLLGCNSEGDGTTKSTTKATTTGTNNNNNSNNNTNNNNNNNQNNNNNNNNQPTPEEPFEWTEADIVPDNLFFAYKEHTEMVKLLGRTQQLTNALGVDMVGSGIEFRGAFKGEITLDVQCIAGKDTEAFLAVFIDGVREEDYYIDTIRQSGKFHVTTADGQKTIKIAEFDEAGEHTIRIVKQTESNYALLDFIKLSFTGILAPAPAEKDLYIEFIGDSLTCGMGSAGDSSIKSAQGINGADWEDGTFGYAYHTAEMLDADYSIISESGIGIANTWFKAKMGDFYTRTSYNRSATNMYDFDNARVPDLVVINLGTNDHFLQNVDGYKSVYQNDANIVQKDAMTLMQTIRSKYGNVKILWVSGVWSGIEDMETQVNSAITALGGENNGIYSFKLTKNAPNTSGAEGHPSKSEHEGIMTQIYTYISNKRLDVKS